MHLGSIEGLGRLLIKAGDGLRVHYLIDIFQAAGDGKLACGSLTGDRVALGSMPVPGRAVLELSDGHQAQVVIVETGRGTVRVRMQSAVLASKCAAR